MVSTRATDVRAWVALGRNDIRGTYRDPLLVGIVLAPVLYAGIVALVTPRVTAMLAGRNGFDLVVGDVPPLAFEAAAEAGVDSVAVANFSWDWIYERMNFADAAVAAALRD